MAGALSLVNAFRGVSGRDAGPGVPLTVESF
jgi:hypothetical protein